MSKNIYKIIIFILAYFACYSIFFAQTLVNNVTDTIKIDSTSLLSKRDTTKKNKISPNAINNEINYTAFDSIYFDVKLKKIYLYTQAEIKYETMKLKSDYIEIDFNNNTVYASGRKDSLGNDVGLPIFTEKNDRFDSRVMIYNFKTKKGIIKEIVTEQGEGFIHGNWVRKMPDDVIMIKDGGYTTCNLREPHFEIKFSKAKVIPDDKIITGPAYLSIEGIPTPLAIPFGFFPNRKGGKSGILVPSYGFAANRGYFLSNGGYYISFNDYIDMTLRGDIYSRGSWAARTSSNYAKRYKFKGYFSLNYNYNKIGEPIDPNFEIQRDYFINWKHDQDPKAHPKNRFSANVNFGSSTYHRNNSYVYTNYLSNSIQSSITYSSAIGNNSNFSLNLRHSQNTQTKIVNVSLPEIFFSINRFYPFKHRLTKGKQKWYEKIGLSYSAKALNTADVIDTMLFSSKIVNYMKNGIIHNIPINTSMNIFKYFTLTPSINYNEKWYFSTIRKYWEKIENGQGFIKTDTVREFATTRDFNFSTSISTRLFGIFSFKRGFIEAIRHVVTPSASLTLRPDFSESFWGAYKYVQKDTTGTLLKYSIFENSLFGGPPSGKAQIYNFTIANNLEMKIRIKKDSIIVPKKIVLIENFTITTNYDVSRDSMKWDYIRMSGRTRLFRGLEVQYNSIWDPYIVVNNNNNPVRINLTEWEKNKRLFRYDMANWQVALVLNLNSIPPQKKKSNRATNEEIERIYKNYDDYVDFDIPWKLNLSYNLTYTRDILRNKADTIQSLQIDGEVNVTKKWKIGFRTGYDFKNKDFTYTTIDIYRDLHCWEMKFHWVPFGYRRSYLFTIAVKASVLQDLKLEKKRDWQDF